VADELGVVDGRAALVDVTVAAADVVVGAFVIEAAVGFEAVVAVGETSVVVADGRATVDEDMEVNSEADVDGAVPVAADTVSDAVKAVPEAVPARSVWM
jgi:hypothetical protein